MAVTFEQVSQVNCPIGATNIAITPTLVASDLVVVLANQSAGGGRSVTPSGFGTWNPRSLAYSGTFVVLVDSITGVTGTGNVTITVVGSSAEVTLWVVRGLIEPKVFTTLVTDIGTLNDNSAFACGSQVLTADQALIQVLSTSTPSNGYTFPATGSLPSAGAFTSDGTAGTTYRQLAAHVIGSDGVTAHAVAAARSSGGAFNAVGAGLVLGEPLANAAELIGGYVEAATQSSSDLRLESGYVEALTVGAPDLRLEQGYVEVLSTMDNVVHLHQQYIEVLSKVQARLQRGWGITLN